MVEKHVHGWIDDKQTKVHIAVAAANDPDVLPKVTVMGSCPWGDIALAPMHDNHVRTLNQLPNALPRLQLASNVETLSVEVKGYPNAEVGKEVVFDVIVTNRGPTPLTGMMLYCTTTVGFMHPVAKGEHIGAELPDLAAGAVKSYKVRLIAMTVGKHELEIRVTAMPHYEMIARPVVTVEKGAIENGTPRSLAKNVDATAHETPTKRVTVETDKWMIECDRVVRTDEEVLVVEGDVRITRTSATRPMTIRGSRLIVYLGDGSVEVDAKK